MYSLKRMSADSSFAAITLKRIVSCSITVLDNDGYRATSAFHKQTNSTQKYIERTDDYAGNPVGRLHHGMTTLISFPFSSFLPSDSA